MRLRLSFLTPKVLAWTATAVVLVLAVVFHETWIPATDAWVDRTLRYFRTASAVPSSGVSDHVAAGHDDDHHHDHAAFDHDDVGNGEHAHEGHDDGRDHAHDDGHDHDRQAHDRHEHEEKEIPSLELSPQARRNVGLTKDTLQEVRPETYRRQITVPAMVIARPGRTQLQVATPMTGVVTHVHAVTGEAIEPGTLLFELRLTHEDLVAAQTGFLQSLGEMDVERRELKRLTEATSTGAVARVKLLDQQYAAEKLEALLQAQREALRLHGLSARQVEQIATERRLLRELKVQAPFPDEHDHSDEELNLAAKPFHRAVWQPATDPDRQPNRPEPDNQQANDARPDDLHNNAPPGNNKAKDPRNSHNTPLILTRLLVHKGQALQAGELLCVVSDMRELYVEGLTFEQDAPLLETTLASNWPVSAVFPSSNGSSDVIDNLQLEFVGNEVSTETRALKFYVTLPNSIVRDRTNQHGQRFVTWRYRTGQRLQLQVPVEEWQRRFVLPVEAVAREGGEHFVFVQRGDHFDRLPVHIEYRDQFNAVIADDGALSEGDVVALTGAHQMQMALKKQASGAPGAHAGHVH